MCSACLAVLMTAGHNALRGSGPGQNLAFEDAVALVGFDVVVMKSAQDSK
jgi:hypothetical protein